MRQRLSTIAATIGLLLVIAAGCFLWIQRNGGLRGNAFDSVPVAGSASNGSAAARASLAVNAGETPSQRVGRLGAAPHAAPEPAAAIAIARTDREYPRAWIKVSNWAKAGGGGREPDFELVTDHASVWHGGSSALLRSTRTLDASRYGAVLQRTRVGAFAGRRVAFSAYLASRDARAGGTLLFRAESAQGVLLAFDDLGGQAVVATTPWRRYFIVIDVPDGATTLLYGAMLHGDGSLWIDTARIDVVDSSVPTTAPPIVSAAGQANLPLDPSFVLPTPQNLDFEDTVAVDHDMTGVGSGAATGDKMIVALMTTASGHCLDSVMSHAIQAACEQQLSGLQAMLGPLGAIRNAVYGGTETLRGTNQSEVYWVNFENGSMQWYAALDSEGKLRVLWSNGQVFLKP
jgi:hypothetical protein